jgi:hypothetical protein
VRPQFVAMTLIVTWGSANSYARRCDFARIGLVHAGSGALE